MSAARQETFESRGDRSLHIPSFQLEVCGRGREKIGTGPPAFTVVFATSEVKQEALAGDLYQTALAYVRGDIQVTGDVFAAIRLFTSQARHGWRQAYHLLLGRFAGLGIETWWQSRRRAAENVRRHYDRSNEFYRSFLDRGMTYSCAYFRNPAWGIEEAQQAKVEYILRKLDMHPGERFLDIGCGWGALLEAAARGGAIATGCTLSHAQYEWAQRRLLEFGTRARVRELDYRELTGQWDKIASVGMFEHVGRRRLTAYFRKVHGLLMADGLFLNHGLVRPQTVRRGVESVILRRMVFPGTDLPHLGELIRGAEEAGFEVLDVESLRLHYALTCRCWAQNLLQQNDSCTQYVGNETCRTWLLYLAACAVQFEVGQLDVYQTLLAKRSTPLLRLMSRDYMYGGASLPFRAPSSG